MNKNGINSKKNLSFNGENRSFCVEERRRPETPKQQPEKLGKSAGKLWWVRDAPWPPLGYGVVLVQSHVNLFTLSAAAHSL